MSGLRVIVGLGNPGTKHAADRHNAGFWLVDRLAEQWGATLREERRFKAEVGRTGDDIWLVKPLTYMNASGDALQAFTSFYKFSAATVLVAHDELDLSPGVIRLKQGGGHGGHNGLRDIVAKLGADFARLRIGIGHPGEAALVTGYVLKTPPAQERSLIDEAIGSALKQANDIAAGDLQRVMNTLNKKHKVQG
ncbi:MAG: aminoacyl-tRNA hydrolase [Pseudomonadota bacterium]